MMATPPILIQRMGCASSQKLLLHLCKIKYEDDQQRQFGIKCEQKSNIIDCGALISSTTAAAVGFCEFIIKQILISFISFMFIVYILKFESSASIEFAGGPPSGIFWQPEQYAFTYCKQFQQQWSKLPSGMLKSKHILGL